MGLLPTFATVTTPNFFPNRQDPACPIADELLHLAYLSNRKTGQGKNRLVQK